MQKKSSKGKEYHNKANGFCDTTGIAHPPDLIGRVDPVRSSHGIVKEIKAVGSVHYRKGVTYEYATGHGQGRCGALELVDRRINIDGND